MGRRCIRRLLAVLSENVEPAEGGSYRELAGSERPGPGKGKFHESEDPPPCVRHRHRRHHHSHADGHEAGARRHGRRHAHRRHEDMPNQAAAPAVVATGLPAESPVIGYPEIYKTRDEEPERRAHPVHRRHHARHGHGDHGVHVHHHIHGEAPPQHLQERHRRHGCRRHEHRCRGREHVHYHYDRDSTRTSEGIPCPVAVGQPAAQPAKPTDTITRRSSI